MEPNIFDDIIGVEIFYITAYEALSGPKDSDDISRVTTYPGDDSEF